MILIQVEIHLSASDHLINCNPLDWSSAEEEIITDDYFVLEGDISSTGGYITLSRFLVSIVQSIFYSHGTLCSVSVPVDKIEPEVIQRRKSDCAPISPRDEAEILRGKVEKLQKKQEDLAAELREKDSELEDLGCWRALLAKVYLHKWSSNIRKHIFRERNL